MVSDNKRLAVILDPSTGETIRTANPTSYRRTGNKPVLLGRALPPGDGQVWDDDARGWVDVEIFNDLKTQKEWDRLPPYVQGVITDLRDRIEAIELRLQIGTTPTDD